MDSTLETIIGAALNAGAQVNISLTPRNRACDENGEVAAINTRLAVAEGENRAVITIDGTDIEYRLIPNRQLITCVPTALWAEAMPFDTQGSNTWADSSIRRWLNETLYEKVETKWRERIQPTRHGEATDLIWLPSEAETFGTAIFGDDELADHEIRLFDTKASRRLTDTDGDKRWWWTRSARSGYTNYVPGVGTDGTADYGNAYNPIGAALPCFNIAR